MTKAREERDGVSYAAGSLSLDWFRQTRQRATYWELESPIKQVVSQTQAIMM